MVLSFSSHSSLLNLAITCSRHHFAAVSGDLSREERASLLKYVLSLLLIRPTIFPVLIISSLCPPIHSLSRLTFANFVTNDDGEKTAKALIDRLLRRLSGKEAHTRMSQKLHEICPGLHRHEDVLRAQAMEAQILAKGNKTHQALERTLQLQLDLFRTLASPSGLDEVCRDFAEMEFFEGVVTLALDCAAKPALSGALTFYRNFEPADDVAGKEAFDQR